MFDLSVAIVRFLLLAQIAMAARSALRAAVSVGRSGEDSPIVKSSAKEAVSWDWGGKSETKKLNRAGESTEP